MSTEIPAEPTTVEVKTEAEVPVEPETTAKIESSAFDSDAFVGKVADAVFDRMKTFTGSLVEAQQAAQQIAADMVPIDQNAAPLPVQEQPPVDVQPQRRHSMFSQPFKKSEK